MARPRLHQIHWERPDALAGSTVTPVVRRIVGMPSADASLPRRSTSAGISRNPLALYDTADCPGLNRTDRQNPSTSKRQRQSRGSDSRRSQRTYWSCFGVFASRLEFRCRTAAKRRPVDTFLTNFALKYAGAVQFGRTVQRSKRRYRRETLSPAALSACFLDKALSCSRAWAALSIVSRSYLFTPCVYRFALPITRDRRGKAAGVTSRRSPLCRGRGGIGRRARLRT